MAFCLAIVSESDFPELLALSEGQTFPRSYSEFLLGIEEYEKHIRTLELQTLRITINPQELRRWLNGRPCTRSDLFRYASIVHEQHLSVRSDSHSVSRA